MVGMCRPCENIFKLDVLIFSLKAFIFNSISPWHTFMLKPLDFYILLTVWSSWMTFSVLLKIHFSPVRKVILDDFVCRRGITLI